MGALYFVEMTSEGVELKDVSELPIGDEIETLFALDAGDYEVFGDCE